jgi:hypothetical protein
MQRGYHQQVPNFSNGGRLNKGSKEQKAQTENVNSAVVQISQSISDVANNEHIYKSVKDADGYCQREVKMLLTGRSRDGEIAETVKILLKLLLNSVKVHMKLATS